MAMVRGGSLFAAVSAATIGAAAGGEGLFLASNRPLAFPAAAVNGSKASRKIDSDCGMGHATGCKWHNWTDYFDECPYGVALPGSVTWPDYDKARRMGAWVNPDMDAGGFFLGICVLYSYVPYVSCAICLFKALRHRGTREVGFASAVLTILFATEIFLKHIFNQRRPEMTCLLSCGMPSSHSAIAIGTLTMAVADFAFRSGSGRYLENVARQDVLRQAQPTDFWAGMPYRLRWPFMIKKIYYDSICEMQLAKFDEPSQGQLIANLVAWLILMLPVPFSRMQLSDHTPKQVFIGAFVGGMIGCSLATAAHHAAKKYNRFLGHEVRFRGMIVLHHNYALPCCQAMDKIKKIEDCSEQQDALNWYKKVTEERFEYCRRHKLLTVREFKHLKTRLACIDNILEKSKNRWYMFELSDPIDRTRVKVASKDEETMLIELFRIYNHLGALPVGLQFPMPGHGAVKVVDVAQIPCLQTNAPRHRGHVLVLSSSAGHYLLISRLLVSHEVNPAQDDEESRDAVRDARLAEQFGLDHNRSYDLTQLADAIGGGTFAPPDMCGDSPLPELTHNQQEGFQESELMPQELQEASRTTAQEAQAPPCRLLDHLLARSSKLCKDS